MALVAPQVIPPLENIIICTILPKVQHDFQLNLPKGIQSMWPLHLSWLHLSSGLEHSQSLVSFLKCIEPLRVAPGRSPKGDVVLVLRKGSSFYHEKDLFALCLFPCAVMQWNISVAPRIDKSWEGCRTPNYGEKPVSPQIPSCESLL